MRKTYILFATLVAMVLLFAISAERAQSETYSPQRMCTATGLGTVVAGPCLSGLTCDTTTPALAKDFPRIVNCPAECNGALIPGTTTLLSGTFLRWDYQFTGAEGISPSLVGLQVSAEITLEGAVGGNGSMSNISSALSLPCVGDSSLQMGGNDCDSVWLKISGNCSATNPYTVSYFTEQGLRVRPEGASFKSGKIVGTCGVVGAGSAACFDPNQPFYIEETFTMPGPCTVNYSITPDCKAVPDSMRVVEGECTTAQATDPILINGYSVDFLGGRCSTVAWVQPGSCNYCVPLTGGGQTCATCTTCCIKKSTGKCVQKSTLTNPATECKSGTL